jgi:DNA-binding response OmpR family regulator
MNREAFIDKQKVLVVDDEQQIVRLISEILEPENYEIIAAFDGQSAYNIALNTKPNLIIMDWDMPILTGVESLRMIKKDEAINHIPVIMITGRMTSIRNLKIAFDAGAIDFIRKPIEPIELLARTRSMLLLAEFYKKTLRQKDWELAMLSKELRHTLGLYEKLMDPLHEVLSKLEEDKHEMYYKLKYISDELKSSTKQQTWSDFSNKFNNVHPNFTSNILNAVPNLSSEELRLCIFLKLNLNTKEIAALTFRNPQSIDIARYRLRKKLQLDKKDSLHGFLSQF